MSMRPCAAPSRQILPIGCSTSAAGKHRFDGRWKIGELHWWQHWESADRRSMLLSVPFGRRKEPRMIREPRTRYVEGGRSNRNALACDVYGIRAVGGNNKTERNLRPINLFTAYAYEPKRIKRARCANLSWAWVLSRRAKCSICRFEANCASSASVKVFSLLASRRRRNRSCAARLAIHDGLCRE